MNIHLSSKIAATYLRFIQNWDNETKIAFIKILSQSISQSPKNNDFSIVFGKWDDQRSADEIIKDIENERSNNNNLEEF